MIIVLDTNVIVSGVLRPYSKSAAILRLVAEGKIQMAYDLRIISEYREVLNRKKFNFNKKIVEEFLAQIEQDGLFVSVNPLGFHLPDQDDEPFLEVALSAKAEILVTGNKRHFPKKEYGGIKILSPGEFYNQYLQSV